MRTQNDINGERFETALSKTALIEKMNDTYQFENVSLLDHGKHVWHTYKEIINYLHGGPKKDWWRIPSWIEKDLCKMILCDNLMKEYLIYHDCGKVTTITVDENGKKHFPNHAKESEKLWLSVGGNPICARLMGMDMDIHTLKTEEIDDFSRRPEAISLLFAGIAEVHSNAEVVSGQNSDSFKIKMKHIDKKGRKIIENINKRRI